MCPLGRPQAVECAPSSGGHQPPADVRRNTRFGPCSGRVDQRVLDRFVGQIEVAESGSEHRHDPRTVVAHGPVEAFLHRVQMVAACAFSHEKVGSRSLSGIGPEGDRADLEHDIVGRHRLSKANRLVEVICLDDVVAADLFLGLGERAVRDGHRVARRGPGEVVGELAMLSRQRRSATVRATTASVVRAIDWTALEAELAKVDPLVGRMLRNLSDKLIETTRE